MKVAFKWTNKITSAQVEQLIRAERSIEKAVIVFDSATAEYRNGFRHNHATFSLIISKLLSANQLRQAEEMLSRMKMEKCSVVEDTFVSICRAYGRAHKPLDAIRVFHKMTNEFGCRPTLKSYVTILDILTEENQLAMAVRFYQNMRERGIPPSVISINVLIKALCKNSTTIESALKIFEEMPTRGLMPDAYTYGTLINGLCKMGSISKAKELFKEMESEGCVPSVITYTSLVHGLCRCGKVEEAIGYVEEMKERRGIEPNLVTYSALMDGFCKSGRSSEAKEIFYVMVSKNLKPNMITYSSLINGFCKEGKLKEAVEILDRVKLQGLQPDAGLYGKIICGLCDLSKFWEAANFLEEMVLGGTPPSRITWCLHVKINNKVVRGLCESDHLVRAFQLYLSLRTRGFTVEQDTFDSLITSFCLKGNLDKAVRILEEMVVDGCVPSRANWASLLARFWSSKKVRLSFEMSFTKFTNTTIVLDPEIKWLGLA